MMMRMKHGYLWGVPAKKEIKLPRRPASMAKTAPDAGTDDDGFLSINLDDFVPSWLMPRGSC